MEASYRVLSKLVFEFDFFGFSSGTWLILLLKSLWTNIRREVLIESFSGGNQNFTNFRLKRVIGDVGITVNWLLVALCVEWNFFYLFLTNVGLHYRHLAQYLSCSWRWRECGSVSDWRGFRSEFMEQHILTRHAGWEIISSCDGNE